MIEIKHKQTGEVLLRVDAEVLKGADLRGADLQGADLRGANLEEANLQKADLLLHHVLADWFRSASAWSV
jgi:uncharacterized protein YjbI with pentapeptide repeats